MLREYFHIVSAEYKSRDFYELYILGVILIKFLMYIYFVIIILIADFLYFIKKTLRN